MIEADKAYRSQKHDELLESKGSMNGIPYRQTTNKAPRQTPKNPNKHMVKTRYKVEQIFGSMVR